MVQGSPLVAYIVVCWNNKQLLKECLGSINNQSYENKQIILVDNASDDDSVNYVRESWPNVTIIENDKNYGFAKANNIGIKMALDDGAKYIALINSDATLNTAWTTKIVDFAEQKKNAACLQGTTLDYYNHQIIDSTHIFVSRNGSATQGGWRDVYAGEKGPLKVFGVNAAAAVYSSVFIKSQPNQELFDESLFMYLEDVDVAIRSTTAGWDNYLVPGARAFHMGSASSVKKSSSFSLYYTYRNNLPIIVKSMPLSTIAKIIPRAIKSDYLTMKHLHRIGQKRNIPVILKGRVVSIIRTPLYLFKRRERTFQTSKEYLESMMLKGL